MPPACILDLPADVWMLVYHPSGVVEEHSDTTEEKEEDAWNGNPDAERELRLLKRREEQMFVHLSWQLLVWACH